MRREEIIKELSLYFGVSELVCPHIYARWGESSWQFLDSEYLETLLVIRRDIIKLPMICNNESFTQRGIRCNLCEMVKNKSITYMSAHILGKAGDFTVIGMSAEKARQLIISQVDLLPFSIRMEANVSWLHIDTLAQWGINEKIHLFNP